MSTRPDVLVIGAGEYVTGFGRRRPTDADKPAGVILISLLELKRQQRIGRITLCGQDGTRFPASRSHLYTHIDLRYPNLCSKDVETFPPDTENSPDAWREALKQLRANDLVIIARPDHLHFEMALSAQRQNLHVLVVKPLVQTLAEHQCLASSKASTLLLTEMHKRLDPFYEDARIRARELGDFSYFYSYMSQPKKQLQTFRDWAGLGSDISYYLNTHHIDWHVWMMQGRGRPVSVSASASTGMACQLLERSVEDTITLKVDWENLPSGTKGVAIYTASWIAPSAEVHSQQRFFYAGHQGELSIDQAHRGYHFASDSAGYSTPNPLFMQYQPIEGHFAGTGTYGYRSIEQFITRAHSGCDCPTIAANHSLPTARDTLCVTAILEAGRISLDHHGASVFVIYFDNEPFFPCALQLRPPDT